MLGIFKVSNLFWTENAFLSSTWYLNNKESKDSCLHEIEVYVFKDYRFVVKIGQALKFGS